VPVKQPVERRVPVGTLERFSKGISTVPKWTFL